MLAYACSFTASFAAAEDALHKVFERLLRGDLEIAGSPESYLYRAIRNASLNHIRSQSRETELEDRWFESPAGMAETALELQSSLRELPEEQREIILMHVWGGMTFDEIATALGTSPNTAASRYRYGLAKLREQFQAPLASARRTHGPTERRTDGRTE